MKTYFDLSTSARWSGHAVGIVRVERELGRRAPKFLGEEGGYCLYVPRENGIRLLPKEAAQKIIAGKLRIEFDLSTRTVNQQSDTSLRRRLRNAILGQPRLYQLMQRLRGRSFSLAQIQDVRSKEKAEAENGSFAPQVASIDQVAPERLPIDVETLIISAGLDWEYKSVRGLYRMKEAHGFRYAAVVYDLIPVIFPHYVVPAYVNLLRDYFGELFWLADYCLSISACTKKDMLAFCADYGIPPPGSDYFPLGGDLPEIGEDADMPEALIGKRYAIFVSTIEPRKNHRVLYQAWEQGIRQGRLDAETCRLVFVGMGGWNTGDLRNEMAANPVTRDTIVTMSGISDAQLKKLYQNAEFSLFPSYYEGYGLPVAEALSYGVPCICSDAGSLPEIAGDLISYCDPTDPKAWRDAIADAFANPHLMREKRRIIAEKFKAPTWDDAAEAFFSKLARLVEESAA